MLRDVRRDWGLPLAVVHDLRRALLTATGEVFLEVQQFVCHYHLAADVGKDILSAHEDRLRRLFRRTRVRPKLRWLIRSLQKFAREPAVESAANRRPRGEFLRHTGESYDREPVFAGGGVEGSVAAAGKSRDDRELLRRLRDYWCAGVAFGLGATHGGDDCSGTGAVSQDRSVSR